MRLVTLIDINWFAEVLIRRLIIILMLCPAIANVSAEVNSVFVSIPPQKQFVEKVGGEFVMVQVTLPPGQIPETFSLTPKVLTAFSGAQLYFQAGVPFETHWTSAIRSANRTMRIVECCDQLLAASHNTDESNHHDLHIWSSPVYVKHLIAMIRDELIAIDPEHQSVYKANYKAYLEELTDLDDTIRDLLADRRTDFFIVSHAAWSYFADTYGLEQIALEKNGKESGPRALTSMINLAKQHNIRTLFVQGQYKTPFINSFARELNADIVVLDPLREDYLTNMRTIVEQVYKAIR